MASAEDERDLAQLLAATPVSAAAKAQVPEAMRSADRHYHGLSHIALLWRRHRLHAGEAGMDDPEVEPLIASAIAFHDVVYVPGAADNEERSAQVWLQASADAPLSDDDREWVAQTIRATRDHLGYREHIAVDDRALRRERARLWVLDLDLTPLGELEPEFSANTELLRREAGDLPFERWNTGRIAFLRALAAAPQIYRTPALRAIYEPRARANFARELGAQASD